MTGSVADIDLKYGLRPFVDAPATKEDLDGLTLDAIDLSLFKEGPQYLEQRQELADTLEKSITTYGFFNLVNFGFPDDKIEHLRAVSQLVLELPDSTKAQYLASAPTKEQEVEREGNLGGERGTGFKPRGYWAIKNGVRDSIDHYNVRDTVHDSFLQQPEKHPELVAAHLSEIAEYYNHIHRVVLPRLLRLCDLILRVPEGTLEKHYFGNSGTNADDSGSHGRLMMYTPYDTASSSEKTEGTFLRGHSDILGFSFITSQPILALQIKDVYSGGWRYVNHRPKSLIVNVGDLLEFILGGYFKACLHRVVEPPLDQRSYKRLVIIYFCNPSGTAELDPELIESQKLASLGYTKHDKLKDWEKIQFNDWNSAKGKLLGRTEAGERNLLVYYGRFVERWHHFVKPGK